MSGRDWIDPYGSPEIYVDGVAYRESVGTDIVRSVFYACEQGEKIIRVKLLIPVAICATEHQNLHNFIALQGGERRRLAS